MTLRPRAARGRPTAATATATALASVFLAACGTTAAVRPIGKGNASLHASLGGPIVGAFGTDVPTPIALVGGGYGVTEKLDVTGDVDLTAAAFGVAHVAPGAAVHPLLLGDDRRVPAVSVAGAVHVLTNITDTRVAPQVTAVAAWRVGSRHLVYGGVDAGTVFGHPTRVLAGPLLGGELRTSERTGLAIEMKWLAPYYDVAPLAPSWVSPGSRGYFAVLIGFRRDWGRAP